MSLKRLAIILIVLAVLATGAFVAVTVLKEPPRPLSIPAFKSIEVRPVDPLDRPESAQQGTEAAKKIVAMLNEYYLVAFMRPERWSSDPEASPPPVPARDALAAFFTIDAQAGLPENYDALGLTDLAKAISRVDPRRQEATKISVQFEEGGSAVFAVVSVAFEATGTPIQEKEKDGKPIAVDIIHSATFWLAFEGDAYKIFAYSAELKAEETVTSAAWGVPTGAN